MRKMNVAHNFWQTESGLRLQSIKALLNFDLPRSQGISYSTPEIEAAFPWNLTSMTMQKNPALTTGTAPFKVKVVFKKWKQSLTQLRVTYWIM